METFLPSGAEEFLTTFRFFIITWNPWLTFPLLKLRLSLEFLCVRQRESACTLAMIGCTIATMAQPRSVRRSKSYLLASTHLIVFGSLIGYWIMNWGDKGPSLSTSTNAKRMTGFLTVTVFVVLNEWLWRIQHIQITWINQLASTNWASRASIRLEAQLTQPTEPITVTRQPILHGGTSSHWQSRELNFYSALLLRGLEISKGSDIWGDKVIIWRKWVVQPASWFVKVHFEL